MISFRKILTVAAVPVVAGAIALGSLAMAAAPASALTITPPTHVSVVMSPMSSNNGPAWGPGVKASFNGWGTGTNVAWHIWAENDLWAAPVHFHYAISGPYGYYKFLDLWNVRQCSTSEDTTQLGHVAAGAYHVLITASVGWVVAQQVNIR